MTASDEDRRWMAHALSLGRRGQGRVWPNPAVGCLIVRNGRVLGRGWTQPGGRPHAETVALAQAGDAARGATAYVTLEPCAHHGKTPPCAEALIAAGVARVVTALSDPNPLVDGGGFAMLRAAGIEVVEDVSASEARQDHAGFLSRMTRARPHVTLKLATSLDGRIATATGESQWITGPASRRVVHALRARHDAVMIGGGTARADDPTLNVRDLGVQHQPVRVVMSRRLDLPRDGRLAASARAQPVWLCHGGDPSPDDIRFWQEAGAELLSCKAAVNGQVDPKGALEALGEKGLNSVFCEGGGALAASLLSADLVDRLVTFSAGLALGAEGRPAVGAMGVAALDEARRFRLTDVTRIGEDVMQIWSRAPDDPAEA